MLLCAAQQSIDLLPAGPQQQSFTAANIAAVAHIGTDKRTDGRTPD